VPYWLAAEMTPAAMPKNGAEQEGGAGEDEGGVEALHHLVEDRSVEREGAAEIALQHVAEPDKITLNQWLIEAEILVQRGHVLRRGEGAEDRRGRVAGDHRHDQENDDRDAQKHRDGREQSRRM
jgi:hypothetical protein